MGSIAVSPDREHWADWAKPNGGWVLVAGGRESPAFDGLMVGSRLTFDDHPLL